MLKNNNEKNVDILLETCESVVGDLNTFSDQITKVIEFKKKATLNADLKVEFTKGQELLDSLKNLEKISERLSEAMVETKQLYQQARMSFSQEQGFKKQE